MANLYRVGRGDGGATAGMAVPGRDLWLEDMSAPRRNDMKPVPAGEAGRRELRTAYSVFPSGVVGLCAVVDGIPVGMAASSFVAVSLDPPLVGVCVQWTSETWPRLESRPRIGVSVLGESHDAAARRLAAATGDRFEGLTLVTTEAGAVLIEGASAWLECSVDAVFPAGDHKIVLLRIEAFENRPAVEPLVFQSSTFRRLDTAADTAVDTG
jgi:flavin reductase (DIM6/NTAB) family NADH-FMN oxidoreductase RutF